MADYTGQAVAYNGHPLYQGRPAGQANDPLGTVADLAFNTMYDLADTAEGLGTIGSGLTARAYEMMPFAPGGSQLPIRSGDAQLAGQMGQALINNYQNSYLDPITQGRPQDLVSHFVAHPLNTVLDVNAVGSIPGVVKGLSKISGVNQAMAKANAIKDAAVAKGAKAAEGAAQDIVDSGPIGESLINQVEQIKPLTEAAKTAADLNKKFQGAVLADDRKIANDLGRIWRGLSTKEQASARAYAEGWHPDLLNGGAIPANIANYLTKAEEYSKVMRGRISGFVSDTTLSLDKYQPAAIKLNGFSAKQWQTLSLEEQQAVLEYTRKQMTERGIEPQYSAHVRQAEAKNVLSNPGRIQGKFNPKDLEKQAKLQGQISKLQRDLGGLKQKAEEITDAQAMFKLAEEIKQVESELAKKLGEKQGFLKTKQSTGEQAIESHYDALRTRWIQISQFQNAYEQLLKAVIERSEDLSVLKNAPDAGAQQMAEKFIQEAKDAGAVVMDGEALAKQVLGDLQGAVINEQELEYLTKTVVPKELLIPKELKRALDLAFKSNKEYKKGFWLSLYDGAVSMSKRYMLGGNLTYGIAQGFQSIGMLEFTAMNGVRSALIHGLSYGLAFNKQVRSAVPLSIADDVLTATINSNHYVGNALNWTFGRLIEKTPAKVQPHLTDLLHIYDKFVDMNLWIGQVMDSFVRAKAGIAHGLLIANEGTPLGKAVAGMFDSAQAVDKLNRVFADPAQEMAVAKKVGDALGNFKQISEQPGMKLLGRVTAFPSWFVFITKYTAGLPKNHPYKSVLLNNLSQLQAAFVADPSVPQYLKGAVALSAPGPNGNPQVMKKDAMNPVTSTADLLQLAGSIMTGHGDENMSQMLTAPLQMGYILFMGRNNPMTGKPFDDPNLNHANGQQYSQDAVNALLEGRAKHVESEKPLPDDLLMRSFFPPLAKQTETILEKALSNGQRSQMSGIFYRAPKLRPDRQQKNAADWPELLGNLLVNAQPIEYDPNAQMQEDRQNIQLRRSLIRDMAMRGMNQ